MKALRDHFLAEGNAFRSLASTDGLRVSFHYKNEMSMAFQTFLTQCQQMFNIFNQENEPISEEAKIYFLFQTIQYKDLSVAMEPLRAQQTSDSNLTCTACCNHLTIAVSQFPEYIQLNRTISGVKIGVDKTGFIYNKDDTINTTGIIKDWDTLLISKKCLVCKEHKHIGVKFGVSGSGDKDNGKGNQSINTTSTNTTFSKTE